VALPYKIGTSWREQPVPPTAPTAAPLGTFSLRWLPHLLFLLVVAGTLARLVEENSAVCWAVAPPIVLLAAGYVGGLAFVDRLGSRGSTVWFFALLTLWCWISWLLPANLAGGTAWLAVPLAVLALRTLGDRVSLPVAGLITALLVVFLARSTGGLELGLLAPPAAAVWVTVVLYRTQQRLLHELGRTREELARQQREAGRLAERARIAGDLHDTLAQELAGNRMLLQAADRDWDRRPAAARTQVQAVIGALGVNLAETRSIICDLTPPALEQDDLATALRELCARTGSAVAAPQLVFCTQGVPHAVATDRAAALLRVAQGLVANACEHASAGNVWVTLDHLDNTAVTVEVRDDGVGFDPASTGANGTPVGAAESRRGFGLAAGRDRLIPYGGTLTVDSTPGRGTRARATLPGEVAVLAGTR
jgi:signal transduction histidine kinase